MSIHAGGRIESSSNSDLRVAVMGLRLVLVSSRLVEFRGLPDAQLRGAWGNHRWRRCLLSTPAPGPAPILVRCDTYH